MNLNYQTFIFDCDGVILNSNSIKTEAFYMVALPYGEDAALEFKAYHVKNAGKSRYEKFDYFLNKIIGRKPKPGETEQLLSDFAQNVKNGLMNCEIAPCLDELRKLTISSNWMVVSGGDQSELLDIFDARGISGLFDAGIYGSPDSKDLILNRELAKGNIKYPAVLLGDSIYDYESASKVKIDFIYVANWSEFQKGRDYFSGLEVPTVGSIEDLMSVEKD